MTKRRFTGSVITLVVLILPAVGIWQRQAIFDWSRLRGYVPAQSISALAANTTMEGDMKRLFFVYHPQVLDKQAFNSYCRDDEQTIVLGCYVSGEGIYLLEVSDRRLKGVEEVTAAHEALHAAYERLDSKERERIDSLTAKVFSTSADKRLKATIKLYREQSPSDVPNELHSILGTEMRKLPAELEEYYARYFTDRLSIVGYSEKYEDAFTQRKQKLEAYDAQLKSLKTRIDSKRSKVDEEYSDLLAEQARMTALKDDKQFEEYNKAVPDYNQRVKNYQANVSELKGLIAEFNAIIPKRNAIADEEQELAKAIDSREPVPSAQ